MASAKPVKRKSGKFAEFITTDTVPTNNLGSGTANTTTFLRGDNTWVSFASLQSTPSDPATTTSTTGVMMGLAGAITPSASGKIVINISGDTDNSVAASGCQFQIRYGTGTAPSNGAALTGTTAGSLVKFTEGNATGILGVLFTVSRTPFGLNAIITGLTVNTAYWIDISLAAITSGTARVRDISISASETP